jgi:hypothetical protein
MLVLLLLVVPKANRDRHAWLILVPLALVLILWRTPCMLFGMSESSAQSIGDLIVPGAMAWTMVWLLGHRLASRYGSLTFSAIVGIMLAIGVLWTFSRNLLTDDNAGPFVISAAIYCVLAVSLVAAMMLAGRFCRKRYSAPRFSLCLLMWLVITTVGLPLSLLLGWLIIIPQGTTSRWTSAAIPLCIAAVIFAGIAYLMNLPFLILAIKNSFYRRRLEAMFRMKMNRIATPDESELPHNSAQPDAAATLADCLETSAGDVAGPNV